jgi:hypothetical protein
MLDVAVTERETHIEPNGVPDDRGRKLVAGKREGARGGRDMDDLPKET